MPEHTNVDTANGPEAAPWVLYVTGPTACGKTSIAEYLASCFDADFIEGDNLHPAANEKMRQSHGLTDEDRWGWLQAIADHVAAPFSTSGRSGTGQRHGNVIVACSALKRTYRDILRGIAHTSTFSPAETLRPYFLFLDAPQAVLEKRAAARKGHYAGPDLVRSQFQDLERPFVDETDILMLDVDQPLEDVRRAALSTVKAR